MEKDLSTMTRDQLHEMLSPARDEIVKYVCYRDERKSCENYIENERSVYKKAKQSSICLTIILSTLFSPAIIAQVNLVLNNSSYRILTIIILLVFYIAFIRWFFKSRKQKHQKKIEEYESELSKFKKREEDAFGKFYEIIEPYKFPRDYWYEYAITQMLKFVENKRADNWKEVTSLYEEHFHRMKMEENAQIAAEQAIMQTEISQQTRNAARWAAAGAWASAVRR